MSLFYETYITQVTLVALDLLLNHIYGSTTFYDYIFDLTIDVGTA